MIWGQPSLFGREESAEASLVKYRYLSGGSGGLFGRFPKIRVVLPDGHLLCIVFSHTCARLRTSRPPWKKKKVPVMSGRGV